MSSQIERSLEEIFGKIPESIEENWKYFTCDGNSDDVICVPCNTVIKKVSDNNGSILMSFETHLMSKTHNKNTVLLKTLKETLNESFSGKIPQLVHNNIYVLDMDEKNYFCTICDKTIAASQYPSVTEKNFSYHLLSWGHVENLAGFRESLGKLRDVYGEIPQVILNNIQFLKCHEKNYSCMVCDEQIVVNPKDLDETQLNIENHLNSLKHTTNAAQEHAFSQIPELKKLFIHIPNYMLRNIEYLTMNEPNLFCSLCNESIKINHNDPFETKQNLRLHNFSSTHELSLLCRSDPNNDTFNKLKKIFETFPDLAVDHFKYLTIRESKLTCSICEAFIDEEDETDENLVQHLNSNFHADNVNEEIQRRSQVIQNLEIVFGNVPQLIQDNIQHVELISGKNFSCVLCNQTVKTKSDSDDDHRDIASVTEDNFEKHFNSDIHTEELEALEKVSQSLEFDLQCLFKFIPQFIMNSWDHLGFEEQSDNFYCYLCDVAIPYDYGSKKEEIILQNFRSHLFSADHLAKLKLKANKVLDAAEKLETIFGKVPNFILSNIEVIYEDNGECYCRLCDVQLAIGTSSGATEKSFYKHLSGSSHQSRLTENEKCNDKALQRIDSSFWCVPDFLLRNIDFLCVSEDDLYCLLCQEHLHIDCDAPLIKTKQLLQSHLDCKQHLVNVKNL